MGLLEKVKDRLWLPHHVAWEFQRRRLTKIDEARKAYKKIVETFRGCEAAIRNELESLKDYGIHPLVDLEEHVNNLIEHIGSSMKEVDEKYYQNPPAQHYVAVFNKITELYENRVGDGFSDAEIAGIFKEGERRYQDKMPPGFGDAKQKKERPLRELYGDLIIWKEVLKKSKETQSNIIFVTEDAKEDWWERTDDGKTIGPLPALRREFFAETGQLFHMYRIGQFAERAASAFGVNITKESAEELSQQVVQRFSTPIAVFYNVYPKEGVGVSKKLNSFIKNYKKILAAREALGEGEGESFEAMVGHDSLHERSPDEWLGMIKSYEKAIAERLAENGYDFEDPDVKNWMRQQEYIRGRLSAARIIREGQDLSSSEDEA